jgi:hypothetical protein
LHGTKLATRTGDYICMADSSSAVASVTGLWDSDGRNPTQLPVSMRLSSSTIRAVMKASSLVVLWLLCASVASAAPVHRRGRARVCDSHGSRLKTRTLHARYASSGGPVAPPSTRALVGLADPTLLLQRGTGTNLGDDVAAIQNDSPAARIDAELRLAPAFEPIGVLARSADRLPKLHRFSPRSPRGPPYSA